MTRALDLTIVDSEPSMTVRATAVKWVRTSISTYQVAAEPAAVYPPASEPAEVVTPYDARAVYYILERWFERENCIGRCSQLGEHVPSLEAQDFRLTISSLIDGVHRGLSVWFPTRPWGKSPLARRWLKVWCDANDATTKVRNLSTEASERFNLWMRGHKRPTGEKALRHKLSECWAPAKRAEHDADLAAEALRDLERSEEMRLTISWLGIGFALAGCSDHLIRKYAEECQQ